MNKDVRDKISSAIEASYGLTVSSIAPISVGVGGDTYRISTAQGDYIYKIVDANEMNHPTAEPELTGYLRNHGIPVSEFVRNAEGNWVTHFDGRVSHLQKYIPGHTFPMTSAPEWFMAESPKLLARIHNTLRGYPPLPVGIGKNFFQYMTPERAEASYRQSLARATAVGETHILEDLKHRLDILNKIRGWRFDCAKLTCANSHGDFTVHQVLCGETSIHGVIDWTSACVHPVIWEITRSFFYADPSCRDGSYDVERFAAYVSAYSELAPLNDYDRANILRLYYYQLAVCDYYAQYLDAEGAKKAEYLQQAQFATRVLLNTQVE